MVSSKASLSLDPNKKRTTSTSSNTFTWEMFAFKAQSKSTFLKHEKLYLKKIPVVDNYSLNLYYWEL